MSLGPCGDFIGFSMNGVLTLSLIQAPFMLSLILSHPAVTIDIFSSRVATVIDSLTNTTMVDLNHPTELHYMHSVTISFMFAVCAGLVGFFALFTYQITRQGVGGESASVMHEEFIDSNVEFVTNPTITLWNNTFVGLVILTHLVVTAVICTPNSLHFLFMITLVYYISFSAILQPKLQVPQVYCPVPRGGQFRINNSDFLPSQDAGPSASSAVASTYMISVSMYVIGMVYVCSNISVDPSGYKVFNNPKP
jgi:hypothetical protein